MQTCASFHTRTGVVKILEAFFLNMLLTFSGNNLHLHQSVAKVGVGRGQLHANTACDFNCSPTGPRDILEIRVQMSIFFFQTVLVPM